MSIQKTFGRGLATGAQLALVAFLSIGLTTTTHDSVANTLSSSKTKASVTAPTKEDIAAANQVARLDKDMAALARKEAALYRMVFAAQERRDWENADKLSDQITDKRLMGHVLADRIEKQGAKTEDLVVWLRRYPTLPDAGSIYVKAVKAGAKDAPLPESPERWSAGAEVESAANFTPELMVDSTAPGSDNKRLASNIQKALRKNDPWSARDMLIKAQAEKKLTGTFAHDVEAVIAASFLSAGERDQATALSNAAAGANQPLGLWVRGLIAWEKGDGQLARMNFKRLAEHPALSDTNRAAAHFWAYRAENRDGSRSEARDHLKAAMTIAPRTFYGMLATRLAGSDPVKAFADSQNVPAWNADHRFILSDNQAGWRALALIQIGQRDRAEAELRRLNPQGDMDKQQAMLALADYVPMPALAIKLANLSKTRGFDMSSYPILPWQPKDGFEVDRALLFALARHESLFETDAVSSRGAHGLMQIMPKTAAGILSKKGGEEAGAHRRDMLFDPAYNMALGQKYVQDLAAMPKIGGNLVLLLAAYNAGPAKAMNWVSGKENGDPLLFLETIPVRETRNYIARVLPHYWAYRARLGKETPSLRQMAEGRWPSVEITEKTAARIVQASR